MRPASTKIRRNRLLQILVIHSAKDLFKYKSFFLLIFVLIFTDKVLKKVAPVNHGGFPFQEIGRFTSESAVYAFQKLPQDILNLLIDYRTFLILAGLFFLKQLISLWPSSDMRRMHRLERGTFGLIGSLSAIRWDQVLWDAIAVSTLGGLFAIWTIFGYSLTCILWRIHSTPAWLLMLLCYVALFLPMVMAGFSFSSKLAIISKGSFVEKLHLFFRLFTTKRVLWPAWIFFTCRIGIELIFVVIVPLIVLYTVDHYGFRIVLATLIATPVYSYLKMASFKFFLEIYRPYALVQEEFKRYYQINACC